jgi:hypothetical protein
MFTGERQFERTKRECYWHNEIYVVLTTGLSTAADIEGPRLICRIPAMAAYQDSRTL